MKKSLFLVFISEERALQVVRNKARQPIFKYIKKLLAKKVRNEKSTPKSKSHVIKLASRFFRTT